MFENSKHQPSDKRGEIGADSNGERKFGLNSEKGQGLYSDDEVFLQ